MKNLYIDLTIFSLQKMGGISVVWGEYIKRIPLFINQDTKLHAFVPEAENNILAMLNLDSFETRKTSVRNKYTKYMPYMIIGKKSDVLHMAYYQWYPFFRGKKVVTVHDFTHELFGSFFKRFFYGWLKRISISRSDVILCISDSTKSDLFDLLPDAVKNKKILVIPNAVSKEFYPEDNVDIQKREPYLLWVGQREGYKNFEGALDVLENIVRDNASMKMIIVGGALVNNEKYSIKLRGLESNIELKSNVQLEELRQLYSGALALLYLSRYEGFGLPILEAQRCGCPVICLPAAACKEVGGNAAIYLDESNPNSIFPVIDKLKNSKSRTSIIEAGRLNAERYSWDDSVKSLVRVYDDLFSET